MPALKSFRVYFFKKKQWVDVYLHDVHPNTFYRKGGGRWGYFIPNRKSSRSGLFGEIHLVKERIRPDLILHELDHLRLEWLFANRVGLGTRNEEWFCKFGDEIMRNFYREYYKYKQQTAPNKSSSIQSRRTK